MTTLFVLAVVGSCLSSLAAGFYLIGRLFAHLSGWSRLEARYLCAPPPAWMFLRQTAGAGAIRFRRAVDIQPAPEGLYLGARVIFRLRPVLIPWSEIEIAGQQTIYRRPTMGLAIGRPVLATLSIPLAAYNAALPWLRRGL